MDLDKPAHRRRWPWILLVVLLAAFGLFKWLTVGTPVTKKDAIASFEHENGAEGPHKVAKDVKAKPTAEKKRRSQKPAGDKRAAGHSPSGSEEAPPVSGSGRSAKAAPGPITTAVVPAEGVYSYATEGGEQISGYKFRHFPDTTYRTVVHTGSRSWIEHHLFLKQRQSWTAFRSEGTALLADWTRQYIAFGGDDGLVPLDERVDFSPPLRLLWLPWELDRTWSGSWEDTDRTDGRNFYGSYTVTTATHEYIEVAGETVEVWMEALTLQIHGTFEGSTEVKRWTSPAYGVAVREECVADVSEGPLHYTADWNLQLSSLRPAR